MVDVARARKLAVRIREVVSMTLETQVKDWVRAEKAKG